MKTALLSFLFVCLFQPLVVVAQTTTSEANTSETDVTVTVPESDHAINEEDKIKLSGIYKFKEHLNALVNENQAYSLNIIMPDDQGKHRKSSVSDEFREQLLNDDISDALETMQKWNLEFKFPMNTREIVLGIKEEFSPEEALFRAALVNHPDYAKKLLTDYDVDLDQRYMQGPKEVTALGAATAGQAVEMIELLLNAGADPNLRGKGVGSPLATTVNNYDVRSTQALLESGATLRKSFGRRGVRPQLLNQLIDDDQFQIISLLLENGMKLKPPHEGSNLITPLMQALVSRRSQMALALLPHSDPRHYTDQTIELKLSGIEDIKVLPRANALFLAKYRRSELDDTIEQAIENRIEALGGEEAVLLSRLQAISSMNDLLYLEGRSEDANEHLIQDLAKIPSSNISGTDSSEISPMIDRLLAKTYEFSLINEDKGDKENQVLPEELAGLSNHSGRWYAMLEIINTARTDDYEPSLDEWQQEYAGSSTRDWDYSRLNNWIGSMDDELVKKKLYRALDYFEFSVSSSR